MKSLFFMKNLQKEKVEKSYSQLQHMLNWRSLLCHEHARFCSLGLRVKRGTTVSKLMQVPQNLKYRVAHMTEGSKRTPLNCDVKSALIISHLSNQLLVNY
jgi:hypothetical protein